MIHIIYFILIALFSLIFYILGKWIGMKRGGQIAKEIYRELFTQTK